MPREIHIADGERIVRVYTRYPNQEKFWSILRPADFARNMTKHSGISLWRLEFASREEAKAALKTTKLTGTAICLVEELGKTGLKFLAEHKNAGHVSARCVGCDLEVGYPKVCAKLDGSDCDFKLEAESSLTTILSTNLFKIDQPITAQVGESTVSTISLPNPVPSEIAAVQISEASVATDIEAKLLQLITNTSEALSPEQERKIVDDVLNKIHFRKCSEAEALETILPIMRKYRTDEVTLRWLEGEHSGYLDVPSENTFATGMPPYIKNYRFVYADGIALRDPTGFHHLTASWPANEQRLQKIYWSLSEIDMRLAERHGEYIYPPITFAIPSAGCIPGWEPRLVLHKSQLKRIKELFRVDFIKCVGVTSELIDKELKRSVSDK